MGKLDKTEFSDIDFTQVGLYIVDFTPELASKVLDENNYYRQRQRGDYAKRFAADMKRGNWKLATTSQLAFTKDRKLINGQHRLAGVILAGITVPFYVVVGADEDDFDVTDQNGVRNAGNTLYMLVPNSKAAAALGKRILTILRGYNIDTHNKHVRRPVTQMDVHYYVLERNDHIQKILNYGKRMYGSVGAKGFGAAAYGTAYWLMEAKDENIAEEYIAAFFDKDKALADTRETILRRSASDKPNTGQWLMEVLLQSCNAFARGRQAKRFNKGPQTYKAYVEFAQSRIGWWTETTDTTE